MAIQQVDSCVADRPANWNERVAVLIYLIIVVGGVVHLRATILIDEPHMWQARLEVVIELGAQRLAACAYQPELRQQPLEIDLGVQHHTQQRWHYYQPRDLVISQSMHKLRWVLD